MFKLFRRRFISLFLLFLVPLVLAIACNPQSTTPPDSTTDPAPKVLNVGVPLWPGFGPQYVAYEMGLFKEEGIDVKENFFQVQSESNTAFLAGKLDLILTGVPDLITMASRDPDLKLVMLCDYSNGSDGILGRGIEKPEDVKGKKVARESLLIEILMLRRYLEQAGLTEADVEIVDTPAADAATSFAAGKVDVAVTWEPFLSKAAKEGNGEVIFTSAGTNIIPDGYVVREKTIQERKPELLAYLRAVDKATKLIKERDEKAVAIIAKRLEVKPEEAIQQLDGVRMLDIEDNKQIVFNKDDKMNIYDSLKFAAETARDMKLTPELIDVTTLPDESLVQGL